MLRILPVRPDTPRGTGYGAEAAPTAWFWPAAIWAAQRCRNGRRGPGTGEDAGAVWAVAQWGVPATRVICDAADGAPPWDSAAPRASMKRPSLDAHR